jgi:hypothetical protein
MKPGSAVVRLTFKKNVSENLSLNLSGALARKLAEVVTESLDMLRGSVKTISEQTLPEGEKRELVVWVFADFISEQSLRLQTDIINAIKDVSSLNGSVILVPTSPFIREF